MSTVGDVLVEYKELPAAKSTPPVLTLTEKNGFVLQSERFHKRLATEDTSKYKVVRKNDIAFNPYLLWAGAVAQNTIVDEGVISPLYPTFKVREGHDPRYVAHLLLTPEMIAAYDTIAFGSVPRRRRSSTRDFLNLGIPPPPSLDQQRRIAAILDHASNLRAQRQETLRLLRELEQAVYVDMFKGDIPTTRLSSVIRSMRNGLSPSNGAPVKATVLTVSAVTGGHFNPLAAKEATFKEVPNPNTRVSSDDFLICRGSGSRALVGVGVSPKTDRPDLIFPDTVIAATILKSKINPAFLEVVWRQPRTRQQVEAAARTTNGTFKVNQQGLGSVEIPLPPLEAQQEFVTRLESIPKPGMTELDELIVSLQSRAFSGQL